MPVLPPIAKEDDDLTRRLRAAGLERPYQGKVRDTWTITGEPDKLLIVATDRISIFDFVLNGTIPGKGEVLTAMNIFWRLYLRNTLAPDIPDDLIAYGAAINPYLPKELAGFRELRKRAVVVQKLKMDSLEAIVRACLTGSGLEAYKATGVVCGHTLADGLWDGSMLASPIFTPTTKEEVGHDEHMDVNEARRRFGTDIEEAVLRIFHKIQEHAAARGILLADTKMEFGRDADGRLVLGDEVCTPDSSRFWDTSDWEVAQEARKSPTPFDKQHVRNWGIQDGIQKRPDGTKRDPENMDDLAFVHARILPPDVVAETCKIYLKIFERLTGTSLTAFQMNNMHITA